MTIRQSWTSLRIRPISWISKPLWRLVNWCQFGVFESIPISTWPKFGLIASNIISATWRVRFMFRSEIAWLWIHGSNMCATNAPWFSVPRWSTQSKLLSCFGKPVSMRLLCPAAWSSRNAKSFRTDLLIEKFKCYARVICSMRAGIARR